MLTCQVLILVPVRGGALRVVQTLISLLETKGKKIVVSNKKRFKEEFGEAPDDKTSNMQRPDDYKAVFSGNVDDYFRIGISLCRDYPLLIQLFFSTSLKPVVSFPTRHLPHERQHASLRPFLLFRHHRGIAARSAHRAGSRR